MKKLSTKRIFLDTNILVYDFLQRNPEFIPQPDALYSQTDESLRYIQKQKVFQTYVASFSIPRLASLLAQRRVSKDLVVEELERIGLRHQIVGLSETIVKNAVSEFKNNDLITDMEDVFQFVVARENRCFYLLTANIRDFQNFLGMEIIHPKDYRAIQ